MSSIPDYPVNLDLNIAVEYPHFVPNNLMQTMIFTQPRLMTDRMGYGGLIVTTGMDAQYHAYDLACPKECRRDVQVEIDGIYADCPKCGEKYEICYGIGNPTQGISREPLKRYTTHYSNGILRIRN